MMVSAAGSQRALDYIRVGVPLRCLFTLVRLDRLHLQPSVPETVMTNMVHAARGSDVSLTMVAGKGPGARRRARGDAH